MSGTADQAEALPRWAAGRVASGSEAHLVHLVTRYGEPVRWRTACPASRASKAGVRQVTPALELVDCSGCHAKEPRLVEVVNKLIGEQLAELAHARDLVAAFLDWAGTDDGLDEGGVVLAVYAGGTKLHPVRADEREKLIARWLEARRRYP
jgi:hypothetical protein